MVIVWRTMLLTLTTYPFLYAEATDVCQTEACHSISERIQSCMDQSLRPCEDFYKFSCQKLLDTAKIPDSESSYSSFSQLSDVLEDQLKSIVTGKADPADPLPYKNLQHLFALCMDTRSINGRGVGHAIEKLRQVGGWPVLGNWNEETWNFLDSEIELNSLGMREGGLFQVYVSDDTKNSSRRIIYIDQADLGLAREFLVKGENDTIVQAYYSYMVDTAVMYGANRKTASDQLKESLNFEIELAKLTPSAEDQREFSSMYNSFGLLDLQKEFSWVDWDKLLKGILPKDVPLRENEPVVVVQLDFLKKLGDFLPTKPKQHIANYMMWLAAWDMSDELGDAFRNRTQKYNEAIYGIAQRKPRWKECVDAAVEGSLDIALSSLYVKTFFDKTSKKEALDMFENVRQQMYRVIQEVDWMDNVTRARALSKVEKVQEHVGYPDELLDISKIESYYDGLVLDGSDYLEETLKLKKWANDFQYRRLRQPVNKNDWRDHSNITVVDAYYIFAENSIEIPAGILQLPFFDAKLPKYMNYAAIGFIMAHEITHGFDDEGSQFDANGDLEEWWTDDSKKVFKEKEKCFIDQYSKFVDQQTGLHVNGINTQGENTADNGGVKLAFHAYQRLNLSEPLLPGLEKYTQDQLFIISMATLWCTKYRLESQRYRITTNAHSPAEFRVKAVLINLREFSKIFGCSDKDAMNPPDKCAVW